MKSVGLGWVPILFFLVTVLGYIIPYGIATSTGHVYFLIPAISDSGVKTPESLVFRELMNISGFLSICSVYIRYKQYEMYSTLEGNHLHWIRRLNVVCFVDGTIGGLAITFVGNFKSKKATPFGFATQNSVHNSAAAVVFITGVIYCAIQTYMSYWVINFKINSLLRCFVRLLITFSVVIDFGVFVFASVLAHKLYHIKNFQSSSTINKLLWLPTDPGYVEHVIANFAEWFMCLGILSFSLTFVSEFRKIRITSDFREEHERQAILSSLNSLRTELAAELERLTTPEHLKRVENDCQNVELNDKSSG